MTATFFKCLLASVATLAGFATPSSKAAEFFGIGLVDGHIATGLVDLSADGRFAVGSTHPALDQFRVAEAFRWSKDAGIQFLGDTTDDVGSRATSVSGDGSVVVGFHGFTRNATPLRAFRWTEETGVATIADVYSVAQDVSTDGSTIVGYGEFIADRTVAFRWNEEDGPIPLGRLPGDLFSYANAVNQDGSVIVGRSCGSGGIVTCRLFRWTEATGMAPLKDHNGRELFGWATNVSADGTIIAGDEFLGPDRHGNPVQIAIHWKQNEGELGEGEIRSIGDLPGGSFFSSAVSLTTDGTTVLGASNTGNPATPFGDEAFYWSIDEPLRPLADVLTVDYGLDLGAWILGGATFADDKRVLAGGGVNPDGIPEGWVVVVPEPGRLLQTMMAATIVATFLLRPWRMPDVPGAVHGKRESTAGAPPASCPYLLAGRRDPFRWQAL